MPVLYKLTVDPRVLDESTAWRMDLFVDIQGIEGHFVGTDTNQRPYSCVRTSQVIILSLKIAYQAFCVILGAPGLAALGIRAGTPIGFGRSELKDQH